MDHTLCIRRCLAASLLLIACAPSEDVTTYSGSLGGSMVRNGVGGPEFVLIGVTMGVARREGAVVRLEFSEECKVNVTASGADLTPDPGQVCVATVGQSTSLGPGVAQLSSTRVSCHPVSVTFTEYSPTRVAANLRCEDTWSANGVTTTSVVRVSFTPFAL
jgi:hypothetical protein